MKPQVLFLDASRTDVGTPLFDEVEQQLRRSLRRWARFEVALMIAAAVTSLAFIALTFWLRSA